MLACGSNSAYTLGVSTRSIPPFSLLNPKPFFKSVWGSYGASFFCFFNLKNECTKSAIGDSLRCLFGLPRPDAVGLFDWLICQMVVSRIG